MAIGSAKVLITLAASFNRWCHLQKTWMPFTDAITFQPAVVPVVGIGGIKSFSYPCCHWSSEIPCLPKMPATPTQAVECHCWIPANPMHQSRQLGGIIWSDKEMQMICHQTHPIQLVRHFDLCFSKHCDQHIPSQPFSNQKFSTITSKCDMEWIALRQIAGCTEN